jgi:GNAT superfamily N-acetyltransferase
MSKTPPPVLRTAVVEDAALVAQLLYEFNREFDEPTPSVDELAERVALLIAGDETVVLLVNEKPDGLAVLRFRPAIWSRGLECYLAELYVRPSARGSGLGRALMEGLCGRRANGARTRWRSASTNPTWSRDTSTRGWGSATTAEAVARSCTCTNSIFTRGHDTDRMSFATTGRSPCDLPSQRT